MSGLIEAERRERLLSVVRAGGSVVAACKSARLPRGSFYRWMAVAAEAERKPEAQRSEHERACMQWREDVEAAEGDAQTRLEVLLSRAAETDWRAAHTMLKAIDRRRWSEQHNVEVTGADRGPIAVKVAEQLDLSDPKAAREYLAAKAELGDEVAARVLAALTDD